MRARSKPHQIRYYSSSVIHSAQFCKGSRSSRVESVNDSEGRKSDGLESIGAVVVWFLRRDVKQSDPVRVWEVVTALVRVAAETHCAVTKTLTCCDPDDSL
jgi:hypothetical protein